VACDDCLHEGLRGLQQPARLQKQPVRGLKSLEQPVIILYYILLIYLTGREPLSSPVGTSFVSVSGLLFGPLGYNWLEAPSNVAQT